MCLFPEMFGQGIDKPIKCIPLYTKLEVAMYNSYEDCILAAQAELSVAKSLLQSEIRNYPAPISGCDAQFNHLLSERQKVHAALESLSREVFVPTPRTPSPNAGVDSR